MADSEPKRSASAESLNASGPASPPILTTDPEKEVPTEKSVEDAQTAHSENAIGKEAAIGADPTLLSPPVADDEKSKRLSSASSLTDLSLEKGPMLENGTGEKIQKLSAEDLTKTKTATSERKQGLELRKTKTAAETIASLVEQFPTALKLVSIVIALALSIFLVSLDMTIVSTVGFPQP